MKITQYFTRISPMERRSSSRPVPEALIQSKEALNIQFEQAVYRRLIQFPIIERGSVSQMSLDAQLMLRGSKNRNFREARAISAVYIWLDTNWPNIEIGSGQIANQTRSYKDGVREGIRRTMKPKEAKGETVQSIDYMNKKLMRLLKKQEIDNKRTPSKQTIEIKREIFATRLAINLSRQTLEKIELQTGDLYF